MKLTGAQLVCESLIKEGVDTIFGLPGGAILPLYQTLPEYTQLKHILVRHEQGAAHAADGCKGNWQSWGCMGHFRTGRNQFDNRHCYSTNGFRSNGCYYRTSPSCLNRQ
jgi:hypothetical protein